jgi:hypothetical protein
MCLSLSKGTSSRFDGLSAHKDTSSRFDERRPELVEGLSAHMNGSARIRYAKCRMSRPGSGDCSASSSLNGIE